MTVVVAAKTTRGIVMAADAEQVSGWQKMMLGTPKIWAQAPYMFGGSGDARTIQVVRHLVKWPTLRGEDLQDTEAFGVKQLWPAVRRAYKDNGVLKVTDNIEHSESTLIVAFYGHILEISGNGCIVEDPLGRMAIGCGYDAALGSLGDIGPWTKLDVVEAVRRSAVSNRSVGGPITVIGEDFRISTIT